MASGEEKEAEPVVSIPDIKIEDTSGDEPKPPTSEQGEAKPAEAASTGEEIAEHLHPAQVDTTLVQDDIVRVSTRIGVICEAGFVSRLFFGKLIFCWISIIMCCRPGIDT